MNPIVIRSALAAAMVAGVSACGGASPQGPALSQKPFVPAIGADRVDTPDASPYTVKFNVYTMPQADAYPYDIVQGNNGYLYASEPGPTKSLKVYLWQIAPSGHISAIQPSINAIMFPGLTRGKSGGVFGSYPHNGEEWLYAYYAGKLTRSKLPLPILNATYFLKEADDDSLWFSNPYGFQAGHVVGSKGYLYNAPTKYCSPYGVTVTPDGNAWTAEQCALTAGRIGRITPSGSWKEYALAQSNAQPEGITLGPDKNLWFTIPSISAIGKITPGGKITEYSLQRLGGGQPTLITTGNDGALWFSINVPPRIGRITTAGSATEYNIPSCKCSDQPFGITAGTGRTIWFATLLGNHIEKLSY